MRRCAFHVASLSRLRRPPIGCPPIAAVDRGFSTGSSSGSGGGGGLGGIDQRGGVETPGESRVSRDRGGSSPLADGAHPSANADCTLGTIEGTGDSGGATSSSATSFNHGTTTSSPSAFPLSASPLTSSAQKLSSASLARMVVAYARAGRHADAAAAFRQLRLAAAAASAAAPSSGAAGLVEREVLETGVQAMARVLTSSLASSPPSSSEAERFAWMAEVEAAANGLKPALVAAGRGGGGGGGGRTLSPETYNCLIEMYASAGEIEKMEACVVELEGLASVAPGANAATPAAASASLHAPVPSVAASPAASSTGGGGGGGASSGGGGAAAADAAAAVAGAAADRSRLGAAALSSDDRAAMRQRIKARQTAAESAGTAAVFSGEEAGEKILSSMQSSSKAQVEETASAPAAAPATPSPSPASATVPGLDLPAIAKVPLAEPTSAAAASYAGAAPTAASAPAPAAAAEVPKAPNFVEDFRGRGRGRGSLSQYSHLPPAPGREWSEGRGFIGSKPGQSEERMHGVGEALREGVAVGGGGSEGEWQHRPVRSGGRGSPFPDASMRPLSGAGRTASPPPPRRPPPPASHSSTFQHPPGKQHASSSDRGRTELPRSAPQELQPQQHAALQVEAQKPPAGAAAAVSAEEAKPSETGEVKAQQQQQRQQKIEGQEVKAQQQQQQQGLQPELIEDSGRRLKESMKMFLRVPFPADAPSPLSQGKEGLLGDEGQEKEDELQGEERKVVEEAVGGEPGIGGSVRRTSMGRGRAVAEAVDGAISRPARGPLGQRPMHQQQQQQEQQQQKQQQQEAGFTPAGRAGESRDRAEGRVAAAAASAERAAAAAGTVAGTEAPAAAAGPPAGPSTPAVPGLSPEEAVQRALDVLTAGREKARRSRRDTLAQFAAEVLPGGGGGGSRQPGATAADRQAQVAAGLGGLPGGGGPGGRSVTRQSVEMLRGGGGVARRRPSRVQQGGRAREGGRYISEVERAIMDAKWTPEEEEEVAKYLEFVDTAAIVNEELHSNFMIDFEPEYGMEPFGVNPDIEEAPMPSLKQVMEDAKDELMALAGLTSEEQFESELQALLQRAPSLESLVEAYTGPQRLTARQEKERLVQTVADNLSPDASAGANAFVQRALLTLQSNPSWTLRQKQLLLSRVARDLSKSSTTASASA